MAKEPTLGQLITESVFFQTISSLPLEKRGPELAKRVAAIAILEGQTFQSCWEEWERSSAQALVDKAKAQVPSAPQPAPTPEPQKAKAKQHRKAKAKRAPAPA